MPARRHAATLAAFFAIVGGFIGLGDLLTPDAPAEPAAVTVEHVTTAAEPAPSALVVAIVGEGTEVSAGQADALTMAADRVCEGITAEVPVMVMADAAAAELGLTDVEARHLVLTAAALHCGGIA